MPSRDVSKSGEVGIYQREAIAHMVTVANRKHTMRIKYAISTNDISLDIREIHRCKPESIEKKGKEPR